MAQKIVTVFTDDLTGQESREVNTHSFSLDGVGYEIDLIPDNYDRLYEALAPFIDKGRKVGRSKGVSRGHKSSTPSGPSSEEIRAWARENGFEVNERGRIPANIRAAFEAAH